MLPWQLLQVAPSLLLVPLPANPVFAGQRYHSICQIDFFIRCSSLGIVALQNPCFICYHFVVDQLLQSMPPKKYYQACVLLLLLTTLQAKAQHPSNPWKGRLLVDKSKPYHYIEFINDSVMVSPMLSIADTGTYRLTKDTLFAAFRYWYIGALEPHYRTSSKTFQILSHTDSGLVLQNTYFIDQHLFRDTIRLIDAALVAVPVRRFHSLRYSYLYEPYEEIDIRIRKNGRIQFSRKWLRDEPVLKERFRRKLSKTEREQLFALLAFVPPYLPYPPHLCPTDAPKEKLTFIVNGRGYTNQGCRLFGLPSRLVRFLIQLEG